MGDTSRKIKNPLLSAAGAGFPFEEFSGNAVLMPVTPATSSVLQDEGEEASFVGQATPSSSSSYPSDLQFPTLDHPALPHHQQQLNVPPATSEIFLAPIENPGENLPQQKQGYLSSLLSSLPNLSLASITGDKDETVSRTSNVQEHSPEYNFYGSDSYHPAPGTFSAVQSFNPVATPTPLGRQDNPVNPLPPANWYLTDNVNQGPPPGPTSQPLVPQPTAPVALPPTGGSSSSYRLGNQRRLKYAPPPDLTTSAPRSANLPPNLPLQPTNHFPPGPPATYFQPPPPQPQQSTPPQIPTIESTQNYNREFTRFSPANEIAQGTSPQTIPARLSSREGYFEPATPQNTPANPTLLSSFAPPPPAHDWSPSSSSAASQNVEEDVLRDVDLREPSPSVSLPPVFGAPESGSSGTPRPSSSPFAPISAARVSEKLEHLLAERKEEGEVQAEQIKSVEFPPSVPDTLNSSLSQQRTTANYFSPAPAPAPVPQVSNSTSGFFDPGLFLKTQPPPPAPTFYNPSQFSPAVNPGAPQNPSPANPQGFFYSPVATNVGYKPSSIAIPGEESQASSYFAPPSPPMAATVPEPTGSATLDPIQMSVNPLGTSGYSSSLDNGLPNLPPSLHNLATGTTSTKQMTYRPVYQHWFHRKEVETKILWLPFSMQDSLNLEEVHNSSEITPETTVATDGGRYDVDILRRLRTPVYWAGAPNEVRRCSWFYKGPSESRYVPYEESIAARLEEEYQQACNTDIWNRRIELNNGEYIVFHSSTVQVHYLQPGSPEMTASWGNNAGTTMRPRVVKRGVDEFNIDEGEPDQVDHLLFLVHGIGSVCDLKFRSVEEVVDEFRSISLQLVQSHYRSASEHGTVHKIEVLPISWHTTLHSDDTGIDKKLQAITLESIPKLRHFTNDTLSDILFYTSPIYCQTIMQTVGNEMNRLHALFKKRNPTFEGGVYLGGHSLGSLILFDLLCHQKPPKEEEIVEDVNGEQEDGGVAAIKEDTVGPIREPKLPALKRRLSRKISYVMGSAGTGQPFINYPQLNFHPNAFFALGSPIGMFVTVRGIDNLGEAFALPTCPAFFNIFHPFDPVAYRVEALIQPEASKFRPKLIPHHKGRKRMHLELKETMARVGADLKQKLLDSVRSTWNSVYQLAMFHRPDNQILEREIDKVVEEQLQSASNEQETSQQQPDDSGDDLKIGKLNGGRRVDYVLQEAPFEYINEYIFALTSHVCYWESEDTMLMILKEIYGSMGIQSDAQLPQQTLTIERSSPPAASILAPSTSAHYGNSDASSTPPSATVMGMDPTAPMSERPVGPPPTSGFLRKS